MKMSAMTLEESNPKNYYKVNFKIVKQMFEYTNLFHVEVLNISEVCGKLCEQAVEAPIMTKMCHYQSHEGHRG